jgi:hypothetical protein
MPILKREFHRSARGPVSSRDAEDWWFLARNSESGAVFVLHEWAHTDVRRTKSTSNIGNEHIELGTFLARGLATPEVREVTRLIGTLVKEPENG